MNRILAQCEQRAALMHGWRDFAPIGLIIDRTGDVQALAGYPLDTSVGEVGRMLTRAAAPLGGRLAAVGMICSAWASVMAVPNMINPAVAPDRTRSRIAAALDREYMLHMLSNVAGGQVAYSKEASTVGGVGQVLAGVMHELTTPARRNTLAAVVERKLRRHEQRAP